MNDQGEAATGRGNAAASTVDHAPDPRRFRAFVSYSHRDFRRQSWLYRALEALSFGTFANVWGTWLHRGLEHYRIDADLVGRATPAGPVPASLRPLFRDRDELNPGGALPQNLRDALDASRSMIVVCSPRAAQSMYIDEEIRHFKHTHRARTDAPIFPIIVDGEPGHRDRDYFPKALRYKLDENGKQTDEAEDPPLAADAREHGDGPELAKLKIVAGLLGVPLDQIVKREQEARRRQLRLRTAIAGVMVVLAVLAVVFGVQARAWAIKAEERLDIAIEIASRLISDAVAKSDRVGVKVTETLKELTRAEEALNDLFAKAPDSPKLKHRQAKMLMGFADGYEKLGQTAERESRARQANEVMKSLVPDEAAAELELKRDLAKSHEELGDALSVQGSPEALRQHEAALALRERMGCGPRDANGCAIDRARSLRKLGALHIAKGEIKEGALKGKQGHQILIEVSRDNPDDVDVLQDLALSFQVIASHRAAEGSFDATISELRNGLVILQRLIPEHPQRVLLKTEAARIHLFIGIQFYHRAKRNNARPDYEQALAAIREAEQIFASLASDDPGDATHQQKYSAALQNLGLVLTELGDRHGAMEAYGKALTAISLLVASDSLQRQFAREQAMTQKAIGLLQLADGDPGSAREMFERQVATLAALSKAEPTKFERQWELASAQSDLAEAATMLGDHPAALIAIEASRTLSDTLISTYPGHEQMQNDLRAIQSKLAALRVRIKPSNP